MEKEFLESCLAEGLSLEAIGERVGRHPSTVSYWLKKHGINRDRSGPARTEREGLRPELKRTLRQV